MKATIAFIFALLFGATLHAQETLLDGDVVIGGFGGPIMQGTSINKQFGVLVGAAGGVIINHTIAIGGGGYGLANNVTEAGAPSVRPYLNVGYGGVFIEYIHNSDALIHFTGGILIGGGGVGYRSDYDGDNVDEVWDNTDTLNDAFFVAEPSVSAELNVAKWCRVTLGGGYRFVSGVELPGLSNSDISGPSARLMVKFGSF
jgi:hypothetical protein